jgi:CRP-like cAMP-binding protein
MVRLLHAEPLFANKFMTYLLTRISHAEGNLVDQLINSTEKRLARTLLFLASFGDGDTAQSILTNISQATLADIIGTTRPRVNFFMNKFKKLGLVDYRNGNLKINSSLLRAILNG